MAFPTTPGKAGIFHVAVQFGGDPQEELSRERLLGIDAFVADTTLEVVGDTARRWVAIAQCFAGGPAGPLRPGERAWK